MAIFWGADGLTQFIEEIGCWGAERYILEDDNPKRWAKHTRVIFSRHDSGGHFTVVLHFFRAGKLYAVWIV